MNNQITRSAKKTAKFLKNDAWNDPPDSGKLYMGFLYATRVIIITANSILNKTILLRSSALSYSTLLAVVPVLAIGFSMLKGLGLETRLEHVLVGYLTAEQEELGSKIIEYITHTDFKALGALGTGVLIYAVIMMLSNVEGAFNDIWGVTRNRTLIRKISDYISVLLLGPLLIVISMAMITSLSSNTVMQTLSQYRIFRDFFILFDMVIPYLALWLAFTAMYILMPNTRVRFVPALIAGAVCGTVWQLAFEVYTGFNIGVARYNKIYGTFAALPIFIVWIYISWVIVLLGAKISNAIQNIRTYQLEFKGSGTSPGQRQVIGLYIFYEIARHFHMGLSPPEAEEISRRLSVPLRQVQEISDIFCEKGLLRQIEGTEQAFQPATDLRRIRASDIFNAVRDHGQSPWQIPEHAKNPAIEDLIHTRKQAADQAIYELTMDSIVSMDTSYRPADV
ncbi:MAG: YihY/virulence factor BrkB family protein [Desulfobacterales bacterium]